MSLLPYMFAVTLRFMQDVRSLVNQTKFDLDTSHMSGGYTEEYNKKLCMIDCVKSFRLIWNMAHTAQHRIIRLLL